MRNLFVCINKVLATGYRYRLLVSTTRDGTCMLLDDPEEPLPVAEMIFIRNRRYVRMWWSMNLPSEPIKLHFCGHRTCGADGTPPPGALNFRPCDNRGQLPNPSVHRDESNSDGHQPESSAAAAKEITSLSTKKSRSSMRKTGHRVCSGPTDVDDPEPDSNGSSGTKVVSALDSGFTLSPSK